MWYCFGMNGNKHMKILSIETSCDETAAAIVEDGRKVLANVIASQIDLHAKTGGVVPEVAAREHVLKMIPVLEECLEMAGCDWDDIDALAITKGPGLISSLIIGTETASVISYVKNKPLIPVQHITGHIYSNWLYEQEDEGEPEFPIIILTVSGGHNELILMKDHHQFEVLGETRDDAAGEAFDKVARILGLGYPGGPAIAKIALKGDANRFKLPKAFLEKIGRAHV
jgi:N6-L-threonylcarbamoyladenine synthase